MPDGEWTDDLEALFARLRTDVPFQQAFAANRAGAIADYDLTGHERRAVIEGKLEEFVALGIVDAVSELPPALGGGTGRARLPRAVADRLRALVDRVILRRPPRPLPEHPVPRPPRDLGRIDPPDR